MPCVSPPPEELHRSRRSFASTSAEIAVAALGIALAVGALSLHQAWLDRHFLPIFFVSHRLYVLGEIAARIAAFALGTVLVIWVRPRIGRAIASLPPRTLAADSARVVLAVLLALGTSELILRVSYPRAKEMPPAVEEPRRQADERLGWVFVPGRTGRATIGERAIDYAFDANGYRVASLDRPVDLDRPTILFAGESVMAGYGLTWEESIPGQVAARLGVQSANLAVFGFASDQAYLRLRAELARFRRPVAIVSLFTPMLFDRILDDDRPHLGSDLQWLPPVRRWRLAALAKWLVPYRSDDEIERGIAMTRALLEATLDLARERQAVPLIVVPQFGAESETERMLRQRILDESGLRYLPVEIDPRWHLPGDSHPDARAAQTIANAIADDLRAQASPLAAARGVR